MSADPDGRPKLHMRTVWISDLHLGTPGCQAEALLEFLREVECDTLYLVGDIIDGWQLRRSWYWPQAHNGVVQCARWLALLGDMAYEFTLKVNRHFNRLRGRLGLPYWSLSRYLKAKVKRAVSYVGDFESAVAHEARHRGLDGVVCGHIHQAEMRDIDGVLYCNDGDWVESLTALVEHADGRLEIIDRACTARLPVRAPVASPVPAEVPAAPGLGPGLTAPASQ